MQQILPGDMLPEQRLNVSERCRWSSLQRQFPAAAACSAAWPWCLKHCWTRSPPEAPSSATSAESDAVRVDPAETRNVQDISEAQVGGVSRRPQEQGSTGPSRVGGQPSFRVIKLRGPCPLLLWNVLEKSMKCRGCPVPFFSQSWWRAQALEDWGAVEPCFSGHLASCRLLEHFQVNSLGIYAPWISMRHS